MRAATDGIDLSATDLSNFLGCRHRTGLDLAVAEGKLKKPPLYADPVLDLLRQRGAEHERSYVAQLKSEGLRVVELNDLESNEACECTLQAMISGADVIVQAAVRDGRWLGKPDILRKVSAPSKLGEWSYEVYDTKLALETRGGTILQLALYSELIGTIQGCRPTHFYVVTPDPVLPVQRYRFEDFAAYFRQLRSQLITTVAGDSEAIQNTNYPEPVDSCDMCRWFERCDERRRGDDHLSFVAGISRIQREELRSRSVTTLEALAGLPTPISFKPSRGSVETYERVRHQASLQLQRRTTGNIIHELLPILPDGGLCRLPEPSTGDVFLDLEGAHFARDGGREYLFGVGWLDEKGDWTYSQRWACSDAEEKAAFESLIDEVTQRAASDPRMHIYHFAPYEPSAMKRLMGRYATRETALDDLLRAERFVDLLAVVKHSLRASVESYSIKALEILFGYKRKVDLRQAGAQRHLIECALEGNAADLITDEVKEVVAGYNEDDCRSTLQLRNWLEKLRLAEVDKGASVPRPEAKSADASDNVTEKQHAVSELRERLLEDVPLEKAQRSEEQQARYLLAYLLDWHRREDKAGWWDYFRVSALTDEDLLDEPTAVSGLHYVAEAGKLKKSTVLRFSYPEQEIELRRGSELKLPDEKKWGDVVAIDRISRTLDVVVGPSKVDRRPTAAFAHTWVNPKVLEDSLLSVGKAMADGATDPLALELLYARAPKTRDVLNLSGSVLAIQGPPGAGKTYTGGVMICDLVNAGKKVGVAATGHKVIRNLLDAVRKESVRRGQAVKLAHKVGGNESDGEEDSEVFVVEIQDNDEALEAIQSGDADVLGGTAWMWARPQFRKSVDVLFVDEAGQMSLANTLALTQATKSLVLLGDPQQLEQPIKGSHPDGVDVSALEHMLGGHLTMPEDRGIFLADTWRFGKSVCDFTSEVFYEGKLRSKTGIGLEVQCLSGGAIDGTGLWLSSVLHSGNRNASDEEVHKVADIVARLLAAGSCWIDRSGQRAPLTARQILVVSPFNAQVARLTSRLGGLGIEVGTVDKFQGREAPVVIYSMATSRPEDAPRGMEFLYNLNRLNVATSRAQGVCILVASSALYEPPCKSPRQMQLANALCRYREMAFEHFAS